jgi:UDP-N-acetylmuramate--alanine ligase
MIFPRFFRATRLHLIGIGGAGMSGIAEVLADADLVITGCDQTESESTRRLRTLGIDVQVGHSVEHLEDTDLVVISSAVAPDHPELVAARERGLTVVRRAEMLAELMRLKYGIAVAGTHGKTTTTSLIGAMLTDAGLDPTVIVGGRVRALGTGARLGKSEILVAEADEFDRSFLRLSPVLAVITSIEAEHLDTYRDLADIQQAFLTFADRVPFFGRVILCLDDPNLQALLPELSQKHRVISYGLSPQADLSIAELEMSPQGTRFALRDPSQKLLGRVDLPLPGAHNARNATAAVAVALALDLPFDQVARSLAGFGGVHRRFEVLGSWRGATVVDDYAHHPTEVAATLEAARQSYPRSRIVAVFQPHLFSRTRDQATGFGRALLAADRVIVTDVYASREEPIPGVDGSLVVEEARKSGHKQVHYSPRWQDAPELLATLVVEGDVVLTLGAGDVNRLGEQLVGSERGRS